MTESAEILRRSPTILLVDWPSRDVPDSLARAGHTVVSHDGPDDDDYNAYELIEDIVRLHRVGKAPAQVDLVYTHRPIDELPGIADQARSLGARAVWFQSGIDASGNRDPRGIWLDPEDRERARSIVESAGLEFVDAPYIVDAATATTAA